MGEGFRSLWTELTRRKVTHVAVIYAGFAAGAIGVVADGGPNIGMSEGLVTATIWIIILGYPVALALAWFLKVGREEPKPLEASDRPGAASTPSGDLLLEENASSPPLFKATTLKIPKKGIFIQTLGGIRVFKDGEEITTLPRQPVRCALLAYIAVERNPPKEKALGLIWPEKDPDLARRSLNQTLSELRKDLGEDWVESSGPFLVLGEHIQTDLHPFQHAIQESRWDKALNHYGGRFLEGFYLSGSYSFGSWLEGIEGKVELSQRKAHTRLIEEKHQAGDRTTALALARDWAHRAEMDDGAQNWYIRLLAETGQRSAALAHAERFIRKLEEDDEEPLDETVELVQQIKAGGVGEGTLSGVITQLPQPIAMGEKKGSDEFRGEYGPSVQPRLRIRKAWSRVLQLSVASVIILIIWWALVWPLTPLDSSTLVCFPLVERGETELETSDVALGISVALEATRALRCLDGWQYMTESHRRDPIGLSVREAREISIRQGAAYFLTGTIMASGDSVFVTLHLHDVHQETELGQNTYRGALAESTSSQIAARALNPLLPLVLDPHRDVDLEYFIERDPAAVTAWIEGEKFYRSLQFDSAYVYLSEAVGRDSLLAAASLRAAQASSWSNHSSQVGQLASLAARHDSLLPPKVAWLAKGLDAFHRGQADSAVSHYRSALDLDPEWNEAWIGLGEVYYHLLPRNLEVPDDAEAAFEEAFRLDQDFLVPLIHLSEIALWRGNVQRGRELIDRIVQIGGERTTILALQAQADCIQHSLPMSDWGALARTDWNAVYAAAVNLSAGVKFPGCAEDAFRILLEVSLEGESAGENWAVVMGLSGVLIAQGKFEEVKNILVSAREAGMGPAPFLFLMGATAAEELDSLALVVDAMGRRGFGPMFEHPQPIEGWSLATWHGKRGDIPELEALARGLDSISATTPDSKHIRTLAEATRGHLELARGDTAAALASFSGLRSEWPYTLISAGIDESLPFERLRRAELLLAAGAYHDALEAAGIFDHSTPLIFRYFIPQSLIIRQEAAAALGYFDIAQDCATRLRNLGRPDLLGSTFSRNGGI